MKIIKIGMFGFGVVGSGTAKMLAKNAQLLSARAGVKLQLAKVVTRNVQKAQMRVKELCDELDLQDLDSETCKEIKASLQNIEFSQNADFILQDSSIQIVVELMGGVDFAFEIAQKALQNGKDFVTANKAMLAYHRFELSKLQKQHKRAVGFEASVCGGIPIIRALKDSLSQNNILALRGIMNGTSNYILTQMFQNSESFESALKDAQNLGYAEADPSFDINGMDAGAKLLILASIAYGIDARPEDILIEGIEHITEDDMDFAKEFGYVLKLLGIARLERGAVELRVHPALVRKDSMIGKINGVTNGVSVLGDFVGESVYFGAGAGGDATASSVVADLVQIARGGGLDMFGFTQFSESSSESDSQSGAFSESGAPKSQIQNLRLKQKHEINSRYYLRLYAHDRAGVLAQVAKILGENGVSIKAFLQKEHEKCGVAKLLLSTHTCAESSIDAAIKQLQNLNSIIDEPYKIRIEEDF